MKKLNIKIWKILIIITFIFILMIILGARSLQLSVLSKSDVFVPSSDVYEVVEEGILIINGLNNSKIKLLNQVDGYSVVLPVEMKVVDASSTDIRIVLEDKHRIMEIYKQPLSGINSSPNVYIAYSNRFLENTVDHKRELHKKLNISGYPAEINQWSRKKLSKVANDKNY